MNIENAVILVVDDNPANLDVLFDIFGTTSFEVSYVKDGESCLELAEADHPDLILLDIMMPGLDGFEVCRRLKANEKTRDIPIIFMTALSDTVDKIKGFGLGAVDYITKPIYPEEVLARVKTHLSIRQLQKDLQKKNEELQVSNTELQASFEREKELNKLKSRFISIASHELRSPLALIGITTNMLRRYNQRIPEEKKVEHLEIIENEVDRMTDILNDVMAICKAEVGNIQFNPECIDVDRFCRRIFEKFKMMIEEIHTLTFSSPGEHFQIHVDPNLLEPVLSNLLSNAVKYSPEGGTIVFEIDRNNTEVLFRIKDQGIGIPETDLPHLFDAFHRCKNVSDIQGTGLGLSIVKQFVELHGGTIQFESEVNKGTTVTVRFPFRD